MSERIFTILENNPETVNQLAYSLGLSPKVAFYDVYSLTDRDLLALIPRPVYALLAIIPMTPVWNQSRLAEDGQMGDYTKSGPEEPVLWFQQTIIEGCGSIGTIHCALNSRSVDGTSLILPGSYLENLRNDALPLSKKERAQLLKDSDILYEAHQAAAMKGDTAPPTAEEATHIHQHFVAFAKGTDGHLYELEGVRKGPLDRGLLSEDEDLLSERATQQGIGKLIEQEKASGGDLRFSVIALAPSA